MTYTTVSHQGGERDGFLAFGELSCGPSSSSLQSIVEKLLADLSQIG